MYIKYLIILWILHVKICLADFCPTYCICRNKGENIKCKNQGLVTIPNNMPSNAQFLDLTKNKFQNLTAKAFILYKDLKILHLDHCEIKFLDGNAFNNLVNLNHLYLTNNNIDQLNSVTFKDLKSLKRLYLGNNYFQTVPPVSSKYVTRLNLDGNKIFSAFIPESFRSNIALQTLVLTNNHIVSLNESDFINLSGSILQTLILKHNNIENIHSKAFEPIKSKLIHLELEGNPRLTSKQIEDALQVFSEDSKLNSIDLRHAGLTIISDAFFRPFKRSQLQRINIGDNSMLSEIGNDSFQELESVNEFSADKCKISSPATKYNAMTTLKKLILHHNKFSECPHFLPGFLELLDLSFNEIKKILKTDFKGLSSLLDLNLANNAISSIDEASFSSLIKLNFLDLSYNRLEVIQPRVFIAMIELSSLDLHHQDPCLKYLSPDSFHLPNLQKLILTKNCVNVSSNEHSLCGANSKLSDLWLISNSIEYLPSQIFSSCSNLKQLYLSNNQIRGWAPPTFVPVRSTIVVIDLSSNALSFLGTSNSEQNYLPVHFESLHNISLHNNHWNCTCKNVRWILGHRKFLVKSDNLLCAEPLLLTMKKLLDLKEMDDCHVPQIESGKSTQQVTNSKGIIATIFSIFLIIFCVVVFLITRKKLRGLYRKIRKDLRRNKYRRLSDSNVLDGNINFDNPHLEAEEVLDTTHNRLEIETLDVETFNAPIKNDWIDRIKNSSYDSKEAVVFLSTENVNESNFLKVINNVEIDEDAIIACHCRKLVIDYPLIGQKFLKEIVAIREHESYEEDDSRDTYVFHTKDVNVDEDNAICVLIGPRNIKEYLLDDILASFYELY